MIKYLFLIILLIPELIYSQETDTLNGWKKNGSIILNVNQSSLQNWAAGGEQNTLGINSILNYSVRYKNGKKSWDNLLEFGLGFQNASSLQKFRKTDDKIDITSKLGYQLTKDWHAAFLTNFNSQMLEGYAYNDSASVKISNFLTPGKILLSPGFDYKPTQYFSLLISPATMRFIIKKDKDFFPIDAFGVPSLERSQHELGAYITAKFNKQLNKWATYATRLDLFSNYRKNPKNIDFLFNNLLTLKFNEWLGTTISVDILYDDDVIRKTQLKQTLGVGVIAKI